MDTNYELITGLEIHVELKTKSKMFCSCSANYFGKEPNTHTCPVCLGLPGGLPVPNKLAIEWCIKIGLALNCEINLFSKFDRKNYFYPDLSKGYQISQYDLPFCKDGYLEVDGEKVGITRVHMEEDTGKLTHSGSTSLIDFNRSGVPLVEIVTEPDIRTAAQAKAFLQKLHQIVRYLDVSNADMEKGDMRLEPNISLRKKGEEGLPHYKVEVKNINSFRFVEKAIEYEIHRQAKILDEGKTPVQETRGWNEDKNITVSQRLKEEAHDYRYFPEPDIPPIRFTDDQINDIKSKMPETPEKIYNRFINTYNLPAQDAEILTRNPEMSAYIEEAINYAQPIGIKPTKIANVTINQKVDFIKIKPKQLVDQIIASQNVQTMNDSELSKIIDEVIKEHEQAVSDFKNGKESVIMYLVGQVMRKAQGKADAGVVKETLLKNLQ